MFYSSINIKSKKLLIKKVSLFLTSNFFTVDEFNALSKREAKKVIKYLAKIQGIKLSKDEKKDVITFINNISKPKINDGALKLFAFIKKHVVHTFEKAVFNLTKYIGEFTNNYLKFLQVFRC